MPYRRILGCNLVLDYLDEMAGKEVLRESLRGEALSCVHGIISIW
ncbi:MAG: hypothetical protein V8R91_12175 [Butyricimonas faecihominis]